jgi:hypothetical protein
VFVTTEFDCIFFLQDVLPGRYNLQQMVSFDGLPALKPKFTEIKNTSWMSGCDEQAGTLSFPPDFDRFLEVEFATNELLDYYGCSIANTKKDDMLVADMRHAIQVSLLIQSNLR